MSPISGEADRAGVRGGGRVLKVSSRSDSFSIFVWARVFREVGGLNARGPWGVLQLAGSAPLFSRRLRVGSSSGMSSAPPSALRR